MAKTSQWPFLMKKELAQYHGHFWQFITVAIFWQFQLKPFLAFPYPVAPHGCASFWQFANETTFRTSNIVTGKDVAFFWQCQVLAMTLFYRCHFLALPGWSWYLPCLYSFYMCPMPFTSLAMFGNLYIYHHDLALP